MDDWPISKLDNYDAYDEYSGVECMHCLDVGCFEDPQHGGGFFCNHCDKGKKLKAGLVERMKKDD